MSAPRISLTNLTLVQDYTLMPHEVAVHPEVFGAIRKAFVEADHLRSLYLQTEVVIHPFTSVGDDAA